MRVGLLHELDVFGSKAFLCMRLRSARIMQLYAVCLPWSSYP